MITNFGKILREYRLNHGMMLYDMAQKLNVPSSYLSSIEMGRKAVSDELLKSIIETFEFTDDERTRLRGTAQESSASVRINLLNQQNNKRSLAVSFARKFEALDDDSVHKLMEILK